MESNKYDHYHIFAHFYYYIRKILRKFFGVPCKINSKNFSNVTYVLFSVSNTDLSFQLDGFLGIF